MKEENELPTVAYEWRYEDWEEGHTTLRHDKPENNFDVELSLESELVRKEDVEALIQDKIQHLEEDGGLPAYTRNHLEELLEEVQNE